MQSGIYNVRIALRLSKVKVSDPVSFCKKVTGGGTVHLVYNVQIQRT